MKEVYVNRIRFVLKLWRDLSVIQVNLIHANVHCLLHPQAVLKTVVPEKSRNAILKPSHSSIQTEIQFLPPSDRSCTLIFGNPPSNSQATK